MRKLERAGFVTARSAGSHGPVDVFAGDGLQCWAIQVKTFKQLTTQETDRIVRRVNHTDRLNLVVFAEKMMLTPILAIRQGARKWWLFRLDGAVQHTEIVWPLVKE